MKREYTKPFVVFESFSMSTNIAGDCDTITTLQSRETACGYFTRQGVVFASGMSCTYTQGVTGIGADAQYNGICYHVPIDTKNLFNS